MAIPTLEVPVPTAPVAGLLRSRMPELDTIRGIAVLLVLFFHGFGFRYGIEGLSGLPKLFVAATLPGWIGVNLFFVLSGFLITGILLDSKPKADYYRTLLHPTCAAHSAALLRSSSTSHRCDTSGMGQPPSIVGLFRAQFLLPFQRHTIVRSTFPVLRSVVVGGGRALLLTLAAAVRSLSPHRVAMVAASVCVICPCLRAFYFIRGYNAGEGYTWLVADGLAAGAMLAVLVRGPSGTRLCISRGTKILFSVSLLMFGAGYPFGIFRGSNFLGATLRATALNLFFAGTITLALLAGTSKWEAVVNRPILQFFGDISYGVYLIHMLVYELTVHFDRSISRAVPGPRTLCCHALGLHRCGWLYGRRCLCFALVFRRTSPATETTLRTETYLA